MRAAVDQQPANAQTGANSIPAAVPRRRGAWWSFWTGLRQTLRCWPLCILFYIVLALFAGLLLLPLAKAMIDWIGYRLAAHEMAAGTASWLAVETIWQPRAGALLGLLLLSLPAWPFLLSLPFTILSGGALDLYAADLPRIQWKRFWRRTGSFALPFIGLLLLEVVFLELGLLLGVAAILAVYVFTGSEIVALLPALLLAALLVLVPWWIEYARVVAVLRHDRNIPRALGRSAVFLRRNLNPAAGLALLSFVLYLVPYAPYYLLSWLLPGAWWPGHILLQQLLVFVAVGTRLARLAAQVRLVQARGGRVAADAAVVKTTDGPSA